MQYWVLLRGIDQLLSWDLSALTVIIFSAGMPKPVQRLAGQAATGPEQDLPFVLDDDAVAQVYEERLQEQQQQAADPQDAAAQAQVFRPRYGHRSPASALAGWYLCCCPWLLSCCNLI